MKPFILLITIFAVSAVISKSTMGNWNLPFGGNIYAATQHIDIEKGTFTGPTTPYLWFRIPLQLLFIGWVYYSSRKQNP
jgi:uncharacterized membrane protein